LTLAIVFQFVAGAGFDEKSISPQAVSKMHPCSRPDAASMKTLLLIDLVNSS
jgi:hypothetical protein